MIVEKPFDTRETVLNYVEGADNGSPFVILPSFDDRWQGYSPIIESLKERYHIFALDTRGRGKSGRTPGKYILRYSISDTIKFLTEIVKQPSIIFGHSNGGWIAFGVAQHRPELVKAMIIGDSTINLPDLIEAGKTEEERQGNQRFLDMAGKPVDELIQVFKERNPDLDLAAWTLKAETYNQCDSEIYMHWVMGTLDAYFDGLDIDNTLKKASYPILILQAMKGQSMITDHDIIWAKKLNPKIQTKYLADLPHGLGIQEKQEQKVLDAIKPFLDSL